VVQYRYQELPTLGGGGWSEPSASNGAGTVVGTSNGHAYRWKGGVLTDLGDGLPGPGGESSARAVNVSGVVVGQSNVDVDSPPHAVRWAGGVLTDLGTGYGAGSGSSARGINADGVVVGVHYASQSSPFRAAMWRGGKVVDLGSLGGTTTSPYGTISEANAVNDAGQVVGTALPRSGYPLRGFIWQNGVMRDLGTLGGNGEATVAQAVNSTGGVAGFSQTTGGETHGFVWTAGRMRDMGVLGPDFPYRSSDAAGINDAGVVVGSARVSGEAYGHSVATVWKAGVLTDLNRVVALPTGRRLRLAFDVDKTGTIVALSCEIASCEDGGGTDRTVILRPVTP
jgi:probable HAF family extracellular repeat protein